MVKKFFKENLALSLLVIIALIARVTYTSPYLEDWDSVQFALAIDHYSIAEHLPHAPGYPIYILMGKLVNIFLKDPSKSLTFLSVFFGAITVIPVYFFAKKSFNKDTAIVASLIFILIPVGWMLSEVALTNAPGLFFVSSLVTAIFYYSKSLKRLLALSFISGLILGIRFTEAPIAVSILILCLSRFPLKNYLYALILFTLGNLIWMVPLILITGLSEFMNSYLWISNYIIHHDAKLGTDILSLDVLHIRVTKLLHLLKISYSSLLLLLAFIAVSTVIIKKTFIKEFGYLFILIWLFSYLLPLVFIYNLEVPRYTLPLAPPISILAALAIGRALKYKPVFIVLIISTIVTLLSQSLSQLIRFQNQTPPNIAIVKFVRDNFKPENTTIIASYTYRQFQYYAPKYSTYYSDKIDHVEIPKNNYLITDYLPLKNKTVDAEKFRLIDSKEFVGDPDIFSRLPKVNIYVFSSKIVY